ncbi:C40 family peptidase [Desulfosporosinus youngiae]|uniref:Cell wall-associated hydrolase, invasion-associated protein n=1 Tax=Desulfosporosinus youngiae DSM 17734 TaxID=768710 RepID=H5XSP2_9FIRM|nr:C40 family peptidase [Desulfosporosinus youngiae]EHQ87710.1 cell wall-associated hydrolase, invasion-associated protein [Desulfosporosinus youngiae DSM 17734]
MQLSPILSNLNQSFRSTLQKVSWKSPRVIAGLSITIILTGGLTHYFTTTTSAAEVIVNGQQIGLVQNVNSGKNLVETILKEQGEPFGLTAETHDEITYKRIRVKDDVYLESSLNEDELKGKLTFYFEGYKVEADGSIIAYLPSKEDSDKLLKDYEEYFVKPSDENKVTSVNFAEKVNVELAEVPPEQMKKPDEAYKMLIDGKITTKDYTVQANDSWWLIARKNDMLTDEVLAGNPGTNKDTKLQPDQIIKLVSTTPYLTVVSEGTYSGTETIPYDVVTKTDTSLKAGQTKVVEQGSNGSKLVTYSYVQKNGIDVTKQVLDEKVVQAPVNQVIAKGPNNKPVTVASAVSRGSSGTSSSGLVNRALSLQGTSYVFGGTSQKGFDCSGFTKYVYASSGISLPRTSYAQFASGSAVSKNNLQSGDLVFFSTYAKGASHVGIYIGGGRFVHASNPSSGVKTSSLSDSFYSSRYLGARRY